MRRTSFVYIYFIITKTSTVLLSKAADNFYFCNALICVIIHENVVFSLHILCVIAHIKLTAQSYVKYMVYKVKKHDSHTVFCCVTAKKQLFSVPFRPPSWFFAIGNLGKLFYN